MANVFIGIGSNLGDKEDNIRKSLGLMKNQLKVLKISSLYETKPVGYKKQDMFLNCAIQSSTKLSPIELLEFLQSIEKRLGRVRTIKNGPRTIDLDILIYDDNVINQKKLIVPHPRLHERQFVLEPLKELKPSLMHPVMKKTIGELYDSLEKKESARIYKKGYHI